jgi:hypothetical protein
MAHIAGVKMAAEGEVVPGLEPAVIGAAKPVERSEFNHGISS